MNIIKLANKKPDLECHKLFSRMERSLLRAGASIEKKVRLAKTLAPVLRDSSSNERHINLVNSDAPTQEKVIALIMLGFPKNRQILPFLRKNMLGPSSSLGIAAAMAIGQMADGNNNKIIQDILIEGLNNTSCSQVKKTCRMGIINLMEANNKYLTNTILSSLEPRP